MEKLPIPFEGRKAQIARLLDEGLDVSFVAKNCECTVHYVYEVMKSAQFQDWQRGLALAELHGIGSRVAIKTLIEIAKDKKAPKQARVSASDKLLSYTGYSIGTNGEIEKAPSTMTQAELQQRLQQLTIEASQRAVTVILEGDVVDVTEDDMSNLLN